MWVQEGCLKGIGSAASGFAFTLTYRPGAGSSGGLAASPSLVGAGLDGPLKASSHAAQSFYQLPGYSVAPASQSSADAGRRSPTQ